MSSKGDEKEIGGYEAPADEFNDAEDAQPISSKFAKKVVNELYERYNTLVRPLPQHPPIPFQTPKKASARRGSALVETAQPKSP
jgi:hypothetical protein